MSNPEISIIVPVYKVEQYLEECVNSILSQSFENFELILVDDGSPDCCPQMCEEYGHNNNRVVVLHKENGGQSSARNYGLDNAKGRYVIFVDSDDILAEDALSRLYHEIITTNADVVLGKVIRFVTETGEQRPYTRLDTRKEMNGKEALQMLMRGTPLNISVWGGIYKREIWNELRMPEGYICEDWYVTPSIYLNVCKVVYIPVLFYLYRDNPQSTMGKLIQKVNPQIIDVAEHCISVIRKEDEQLYIDTLWSNLRRVWKYVGIIYNRESICENSDFLDSCTLFLKKYLLKSALSGKMNILEIIGVSSFCFCKPFCSLLYKIK